MKLIIDIDETAYERCCVIADIDGSPILKAIANGTPLDDLRAEIVEIHLIGYATVNGKREIASRAVMQILDKYKAESDPHESEVSDADSD